MQKWFHAALSSANADGVGWCRKVGARSNRAGLDALVHAVQAKCTHDSNFTVVSLDAFVVNIGRHMPPPVASTGTSESLHMRCTASVCWAPVGSSFVFRLSHLPSKFGFRLSVRKTFQLYSCFRFLSSLYPHQGHVKAFFNSKHFTAFMFGFDASASILAVANKSTTNGETSRANKKNQI